jgi:hypothetical protein
MLYPCQMVKGSVVPVPRRHAAPELSRFVVDSARRVGAGLG